MKARAMVQIGDRRLETHDLNLEDAAPAIRILAGEVPGEEGICLALHPGGPTP